jgi:hypothetical protein
MEDVGEEGLERLKESVNVEFERGVDDFEERGVG